MPDEICGAPTNTTDQPCQHPAGSCPIHDTTTDPGRPSKFTDDRRTAALDAARDGMSKAGCARAAGVAKSTLQDWLEKHDGFRNAFAQARAAGERELVREGLAGEVDSSMAKFLLSTSFDYYERREVEHDGEVELGDVVVDFEETDT